MPDQAKIAHLSLFDLAYMLKACPDEDFQHRMFALAEVTANVLTDEQLSNCDLRARFASDGKNFVVKIGDLNAEGFAFAGKGYQRWLSNTDRWKGERSVARLEDALRKQIATHRRAVT